MTRLPRSAVGICAALLLPAAAGAQQPRLTVSPDTALIDVPLQITASGLRPGQRVALSAVIREDSVDALLATATFIADSQGRVDASTMAPLAGTYAGVSPAGLLWSGQRVKVADLSPPPAPSTPFALSAPYDITFTLRADGELLAQAQVTRRFVSPTVRVSEVRDSGLVGRLFLPGTARGTLPGVVVLSGSEGGYESSSFQAGLLASHGFAALALAYFRAPGLPDELALIPLEYLKRGIDWLGARPDVDGRRLAVWGGSRGAELALLLGATFPVTVRVVVAYAPSIATGAGLTRDGRPRAESAWTLGGRQFPIMEIRPPPEALAQFSRPDPVRLRLLYEPGLSDSAALAHASIPVERIAAAVILISGEDDQMGPSDIAGDMIIRRLEAARHAAPRLHLKYPHAGHLISVPFLPTALRLRAWRFAVGGTSEGYAHADADSWPRVLRFLQENLTAAH